MDRSSSRKSLLVTLLVLVPLAAAALGAASAGRMSGAPPVPPIIATFDLGNVIKGLDEYKGMQESFKQKGEQFQADILAKKTAIEGDQKRYDTMPPGPEKKALAQALIRNALQLKFDSEYATQFMDQLEGEMLRDIGDRIAVACKEMAIKNKFTIVMSDDSDTRAPRGSSKDVQQGMMLKRLWYVDPPHDVTKELIDMMNNQFAAGAKAP